MAHWKRDSLIVQISVSFESYCSMNLRFKQKIRQLTTSGGLLTGAIKSGSNGIQECVLGSKQTLHHRHLDLGEAAAPAELIHPRRRRGLVRRWAAGRCRFAPKVEVKVPCVLPEERSACGVFTSCPGIHLCTPLCDEAQGTAPSAEPIN